MLIALAGGVSLFATYWDDAWHTDVGRDSALIPPHLTLYGAVAVAGLIVLGWASRVLVLTRSPAAVVRHQPLLLGVLGGGFTLAAAPIDAAWHVTYGRDAVLWSPPHMLVVFASTTMAIGVLAGLRRTRRGSVEAGVAALVLGSLTMALLEYDTDVPQFSEALYLPVLLLATLFAAGTVRRLVPHRYVVTTMVAVYALVRVAIMVGLAALGRSSPDLPIAVLGLAAMDLPWRKEIERYAAGAAGVSAAAWAAAASGLASQSAGAVGLIALPVLIVAAAVLVAARGHRRSVTVLAAMACVPVFSLLPASPARAHDPGQGERFTAVRLSVVTDGSGLVRLTARPQARCSQLSPDIVVARRAGRMRTAPLESTGMCGVNGTIRLPRDGLWFVYTRFKTARGPVEAWLPVRTDKASETGATRELYHPAGTDGVTAAEFWSGLGIYLIGLSLLATALIVTRRSRLTGEQLAPGAA